MAEVDTGFDEEGGVKIVKVQEGTLDYPFSVTVLELDTEDPVLVKLTDLDFGISDGELESVDC